MLRVAAYARYSDDSQSAASIEDQMRLCRERASREGWQIVDVYSDEAISGASIFLRAGFQRLMRDAREGRFDLVLAESLDRVSRDQEEVAGIYKRLKFANVKMVTLSDGDITPLHIGLKGTMNAIFLTDLADKTRRGLRGRVESGKSGGGNSYGYEVVRRILDNGEYAKGERRIDDIEAAVVRRIFNDYLNGHSPKAISKALNAEGIASPTGSEWGPSTIYGNRERGNGILNNELYIGRLVWNRQRFVKDPDTGRRRSRPNAPSEVIRQDVPDLRIIEQSVWDRVKEKQGEYNKKDQPLCARNRPRNLFSGLTKCGCCGGAFSVIGRDMLGCVATRDRGTCNNRLRIGRETLEQMILGALGKHLMNDELCAEFCRSYTDRMNELRREKNASVAGYRAELAKIERERQQIIRSIAEGVPGSLLKDRAIIVEKRRAELEAILSNVEESPVIFHPAMGRHYHQEIQNLANSLSHPSIRGQAGAILRTLIQRIVLTPREDAQSLSVDLIGDLAGILTIATKNGRDVVDDALSKLQPVQSNGSNAAVDLDDGESLVAMASGKSGDRLADLASTAMVAGARCSHHYPGKDSSPTTPLTNVKAPVSGGLDALTVMGAGAGFEPAAFRL